MGVLDRVAARVEAMMDPAVEITEHMVRASVDLASSGLRFMEREMRYMEREFQGSSKGKGPGRGKKR